MRRVIKWHRGLGTGRHPEFPQLKLPRKPSAKKVQKSFLIDEDDSDYLIMIGDRLGLPRVQAILVVFAQWLSLPVLEPTPKKK